MKNVKLLFFLLTFWSTWAIAQVPKLEIVGTAFEQVVIEDGFEDGLLAPFVASAGSSWIVSNIAANSGALSASPGTNRCSSAQPSLSLNVTAPVGVTSYVKFNFKMESNFAIEFYIDNVVQYAYNSSTIWAEKKFYLGEGTHVLRWTAIDNRTCTTSSTEYDNVFLDDVKVYYQGGIVQIQDGTEGAMKVLTSDDQGNASWQDPQSLLGDFSGIQCLSELQIKNPYLTHSLYGSASGSGRLSMYQKGAFRVSLAVADGVNNYGYLNLYGPNGNNNVSLSANSSTGDNANRGAMYVRDIVGTVRGAFYVNSNDDGAFYLRGSTGQNRVYADVMPHNSGRIILYGPNGNENVRISDYSSSGDFANRGTVSVKDKVGNTQVSLRVQGDELGYVYTDRIYMYNPQYGDYKNVQWRESTGEIRYDNSSRRFKRNIKPIDDDFTKILKAQAMTYTRPDEPDRWEVGYIAEDMLDIGLERLVSFDKEGLPDGFNYEKMITYVTEVLKIQEERIKLLEEKLASSKTETKSK